MRLSQRSEKQFIQVLSCSKGQYLSTFPIKKTFFFHNHLFISLYMIDSSVDLDVWQLTSSVKNSNWWTNYTSVFL